MIGKKIVGILTKWANCGNKELMCLRVFMHHFLFFFLLIEQWVDFHMVT